MDAASSLGGAWERFRASFEGEAGANDFALALVAALAFPPLRYLLDRTVFDYVGASLVAPRARRALLERARKRKALAYPSGGGEGAPPHAAASSAAAPAGLRRRAVGRNGVVGGADACDASSMDADDGAEAEALERAVRSKVDKFKESCWKALVYASFSLYGFAATVDKPWFLDRAAFWQVDPRFAGPPPPGAPPAWEGHHCPRACVHAPWPACSTASFPLAVKVYYAIELGFYVQALFSLVFWETRRKDFAVMMLHHVVTLALIFYSHHTTLLRIGTMVFLLHDLSDVPMELAKAFKYLDMPTLTAFFLGAFFLVWTLSRLVYFPAVIIRAAMWEAVVKCPHIPHKLYMHFAAFNCLLVLLLGCHVYWTALILQIVAKAIFQGKIDDVREGKDGPDGAGGPEHDTDSEDE